MVIISSVVMTSHLILWVIGTDLTFYLKTAPFELGNYRLLI